MDNLVFENRFKNYGAYDLRVTYPERIKWAYILTFSIMTAPVLLFVMLNNTQKLDVLTHAKTTNQDKTECHFTKIIVPKGQTQSQKHNYRISDTDAQKDTTEEKTKENKIASMQGLVGLSNTTGIIINKGSQSQEGGFGGGDYLIPKKIMVKPRKWVTSMPAFPGGEKALTTYFTKNINYSENDKIRNIEGTIYVEFTVNTDGSVGDLNVVKDIGGSLAEQVVNAVRNMPAWQPGKEGTEIVPVRVTLPVRCSLNN